ncbi:MAG: hypothetical protein HC920_16090 [Oscillatoriales cyanobacterium SM2_3_0]|nr:hypothetical protein [Oscillatoriales cyanobacterium SM2_3_0]
MNNSNHIFPDISYEYQYYQNYQNYYAEINYPPKPSSLGTACIILSAILAPMLSQSAETPTTMANIVAVTTGIGLLTSIALDFRGGLRNLFRTDLMCLVSIYFLTLFEFLSLPEDFNKRISVDQANQALIVICIGIAGLAIGRHLIVLKPVKSKWLNFSKISNKTLFLLFIVSSFLGFLHILLTVDFNIFTMIDELLGPRFSQPWGRGRLGGWSTLLTEVGLLRLVIPPLAGIILNRRSTFPKFQIIIVILIFLLTLFQGFASGSRNIYVAYFATFLMSYILTIPRNTLINTMIPVALSAFLVMYGSYHMLEFRTIGLRNYVVNKVYESGNTRTTLAVDYNLAPLGQVISVFPISNEFLGTEVLVWSLIKPIPRAFWPSKPEGLSISIEESVGAGAGYTVATTYLGESYIMAGHFGVIATSLFLVHCLPGGIVLHYKNSLTMPWWFMRWGSLLL